MATQQTERKDRRKHYRLRLGKRKQQTVELVLAPSTIISAQLLDISAGGLRCLIPGNATNLPTLYQYIERIFVQSRLVDESMSFSGTVCRLEQSARRRGHECAVEFGAIFNGFAARVDDYKFASMEANSQPQRLRNFLSRLQQAFPHARAQNRIAQRVRRESIHEAFRDLAFQLPPEERWWFYFVIDALKNSGPKYQKGLLAEYIKLCRQSLNDSDIVGSSESFLEL